MRSHPGWHTTYSLFERNYGFYEAIEIRIKFLTPNPFDVEKPTLGFGFMERHFPKSGIRKNHKSRHAFFFRQSKPCFFKSLK